MAFQRGEQLMNPGQIPLVTAGRGAARLVTNLEVGEPPPGAPVVTGLAEEALAMSGRPAREQTKAMGNVHKVGAF